MIQGVQDVFEILDKAHPGSGTQDRKTEVGGDRKGKIVLIGTGMMGLPFEESLVRALGTGE